MRLRVKSNNNEVTMSKELYDQLPISQKRAYEVVSLQGTEKNQTVKNEAPDTGNKNLSGKKK